ncbi:MAG TPA: MFS transporter [Chthoniobacteraceae bacterium]|jgi:MFS family permease|nr:MFS transporter [Chthoniobacteraceae bacterium]
MPPDLGACEYEPDYPAQNQIAPDGNTYRAGSLLYTSAGLVSLFFWLLAGDFLFSLMEGVEPRILPLLLQRAGASNTEIAVIVTSLAAAVNSFVNPIVSYRSDRTQSRWGRRIPYLAVATPFVALFLAAIPFSPEIAHFLLRWPPVAACFRLLPIAPVLFIFAVLVVFYQVFNMIVGSIYYYLLRDVVPLGQLGKMISLFRVVAYLAAFVFNYWMFGSAEAHAREIFCSIAACYAAGYLLMCWKVREGTYHHLPDTVREGRGPRRIIRNYLKESFGHPLYRWVYATRVFSMSSASAAVFAVFFARDQLHLDLDTIGKLSAWPVLFCLPLAYPFGILLDRWGSIRALGLTIYLTMACNLLGFFFIHDRGTLLGFSIVIGAAGLLFNIGQSVFLQTMFHPDRVGQLSSANALLVAVSGVILGPVCGAFFDWVKDYRYIYLWPVIFSAIAGLCLHRTAYYWRQCGGPSNYHPPLAGDPCKT